MTGSLRIERFETSPSTRFWLTADEIETSIDDNSSVVRCYIGAAVGPVGNSTSRFLDAGEQVGSIDTLGIFHTHSGDPFMPAGYARGQERWEDGPFDVTVPHNVDGSRTIRLRMTLNYGPVQRNLSTTLKLSKIPRVPYAFLRWDGATEKHAVTAVRWDGTKEVALTTAVRWDGTKEVSLL